MRYLASTLAAAGTLSLCALALAPHAAAHGGEPDANHHENGETGAATHEAEPHGEPGHHDLEQMREMHRGHEHEHDFEAVDHLSPEQRTRVLALMRSIGLALPPMDPKRGRKVFLDKGCVACHQVNGVGGDLGPTLNAEDMPEPMNAFEFAARMWRGAPAMTELQEEILGDVITLDGQELANIIAFAHDKQAQAKLSKDQIPEKFRNLIQDE